MTKIIRLRHVAVIAGIVLIAIGMAVGTICHFVAGGFFNYGDEFASYKSVEITTSVPEDFDGGLIQGVASDELSSLGAYETSYSQGSGYTPNTVVYKFYETVSDDELAAAVSAIEARFAAEGMEDASVAWHTNLGFAGGVWQLNYVAIALASAVVLQAVYFALRYRPGMALSALAVQLFAVGLYASLLAITRCPVGLEAIAFAVIVAVLNVICCGVFFQKLKASFKDDANAKTSSPELVADGARSTAKVNAFVCAAAALSVAVFAIFAVIAAPAWATLAPFGACLLAVAACALSSGVLAPASYALFCGMDRRAK